MSAATLTNREAGFEMVKSRAKVAQLLKDVISAAHVDFIAEQRGEPRQPVCMAVEVTPYNLKGQRTGPLFEAVTKDVSADGMAILHTAAVRDLVLVVRFPELKSGHERRVTLQVVRRRPVGPLWEIGGKFLTDSE